MSFTGAKRQITQNFKRSGHENRSPFTVVLQPEVERRNDL
jgi:hypothetical protein